MKKKGLIISTIVMVIVLIASLTTATYAWFTPQTATSIEGFNVAVTSNNAVRIGVSKSGTLATTVNEDAFVSGTVTYAADTTSGKFASTGGSIGWKGTTTGLSSTIDHNIAWGEQAKAVGFAAAEQTLASIKDGDLSNFSKDAAYAYSANGANDGSTLTDAAVAVANNNGMTGDDLSSDYVHLTLGVAPLRALKTNQLIIYIDTNTSGGKTLGIMAALHVAVRVDGADTTNDQAWTDYDFFGDANTFSTAKSDITHGLTEGQQAAYTTTYGTGNTVAETGAKALVIDLGTAVDAIDQVEIVIYISGEDADCNNAAITNAGGDIKLFFFTEDVDTAA